MFAVKPVTVARWAEDGKLPGFKTLGGHWRFRRADVEAALAKERSGEEPAVGNGAS